MNIWILSGFVAFIVIVWAIVGAVRYRTRDFDPKGYEDD